MIVVDIINVSIPLLMKFAIDAIPNKDANALFIAGGALIGMMFIQSIARYFWRIIFGKTSHTIAKNLRLELYSQLQKLPLSYYQKIRTGDLMSRATNDIDAIRMAMGPGVLVTMDAIVVLCFLFPVMFYLSPKLTLLAFVLYPLVPPLTVKIGGAIEENFSNMQKKLSDMSAYTQESFRAIRLIKSLVLETKVHERFGMFSEKYRDNAIKLARYESVFGPSLTFISRTGITLILVIGGLDVIEGVITVGTFVAFQRFIWQLSWPMEAIGWSVTLQKEGIAAHRRIQDVLTAPKVSSTWSQPIKISEPKPMLEIKEMKHSFGEKEFQLEIANVRIEDGQKIGIVGPVGAGKTTLFNLILRLYEPKQNMIFWRGQDVTAVPLETLRKEVASVEQQVFLFSEDIRENIRMGTENTVDQRVVSLAGQHACIEHEVLALDNGYDATLGERGIDLSGGQKQRVAIARALVREPSLILLDDCFSAVDVHIEDEIIKNLVANYKDLSMCLASHRLSMMPHMDEVWVLDGGRIIAKGAHKELLSTSSLYKRLWHSSEKEKKKDSSAELMA